MKQLFIFILVFLFFANASLVYSAPLQANVSKEGSFGMHKIIDADTRQPVKGARVALPKMNTYAVTDENGVFTLNVDITGSTILSVEKDGYRPFSMTINNDMTSSPMVVGIEKSSPIDIVVDKNLFHIGDNNYSELSANAGEFRVKPIGPYYTKKVKIQYAGNETYLVIGSIIGVDTKMAQLMGQNKISYAYASPPEVFFNGYKIAEIQLNGDGQRIKLPRHLIKPSQENEITIKSGRNMAQNAYIDYDDIEIANISIVNK